MSLKVLKIITIIAPATFVAVFELLRHRVFSEQPPQTIGNIILFGVLLVGAYLFSRFAFGRIDRAQQVSLRRNQELTALNTVAAAVSESLDLEVVLYRALDKVLEVTNAEAGEIYLLDALTQDIVRRVHTGHFPGVFLEKTRYKLGEGYVGSVVQSGEPLVLDDSNQPIDLPWDESVNYRLSSLASVPLKSKNAVIGVINIISSKPERFASDDIQLLLNIGNQISVAIENAKLHEKVQSIAVLEERERIAREMHDGLAQVLSYVSTKTQAATQLITKEQGKQAKKHLEELEDVAQEMYIDVRETILGLRSTDTLNKGLIPSLEEYIVHFRRLSNINVKLELSNGYYPTLPLTTELQVMRIIQEALTNVRKHAKTKHARVHMASEHDIDIILIEDDGVGFDTSNVPKSRFPKFGVQTMKERAISINGSLGIKSTPGKGTTVTLSIPQTLRRAT
jgi:signal transduction histidine kinase